MTMASKMFMAVALMVTGASGFRTIRRKKAKTGPTATTNVSTQVIPADVDGVWALGAPGAASPGFVKPGADPCFPGVRMWNRRKDLFLNYADTAVTVTGVLGFRHPMSDGLEAQLNKGTVKVISCGSDSPNLPRGPAKIIHDMSMYIEEANKLGDEMLSDVANVATAHSFVADPDEVAQKVQTLGWNLIGSAFHPGGENGKGGYQVSHLIQHPTTKVCLMTFQGSNSSGDWNANFDTTKAHFCGLVPKEEKCGSAGSTPCTVKNEGDSFVHRGFRDHLRRIIKHESWQSNVRARLPGCSEVHVTGHSLGGAMATMFAACVARRPQPGQFGYDEDYKYFAWAKQ